MEISASQLQQRNLIDINGKTGLDGGWRTTIEHRYEILVRTHRVFGRPARLRGGTFDTEFVVDAGNEATQIAGKNQTVVLEPMLALGFGGGSATYGKLFDSSIPPRMSDAQGT